MLLEDSKGLSIKTGQGSSNGRLSDTKTQANWQIDKFSSLLPQQWQWQQQQQQQFKELEARCSRLKRIHETDLHPFEGLLNQKISWDSIYWDPDVLVHLSFYLQGNLHDKLTPDRDDERLEMIYVNEIWHRNRNHATSLVLDKYATQGGWLTADALKSMGSWA